MTKAKTVILELTIADSWTILRALAEYNAMRGHDDHTACNYLAERLLRLVEEPIDIAKKLLGADRA